MTLFYQFISLSIPIVINQGPSSHLPRLDLVPRAIKDLIGSLCPAALVLRGVHGFAFDAQAAALHDPLLGGHVVAELL